MNTSDKSDTPIWVAGLKREAENQLPHFCPSLHSRIMRHITSQVAGTMARRRILRPWRFPQMRVWGVAAIAASVVGGGLLMRVFIPAGHVPAAPPTAQAINVSGLIPDPGLMIQRAAWQCQRQFAAERFAGLQTQARQLTDYVVKKIELF